MHKAGVMKRTTRWLSQRNVKTDAVYGNIDVDSSCVGFSVNIEMKNALSMNRVVTSR